MMKKINEVTMPVPSNFTTNDFNNVLKTYSCQNLTLNDTGHLFHIFLAN